LSLIERKPLRFSEPIALAADQIGDEISALLPRGVVSLTQVEIDELKRYFAADGAFPAVHITSGELERNSGWHRGSCCSYQWRWLGC
jgi:hypothetical protein